VTDRRRPRNRPSVTRAVVWVFATLAGCAEPVAAPPPTRPPLPALETAVDLDPDPGVVEVRIEAVAAGIDYRDDGSRTAVAAYRDAGRPGSGATVPGPLIIADVGDTLIVHFTNRLADRTTTIHWHGLRLPAAMDGNPMLSGAVYPDDSFTYTFTARDAGLFWYHPHVDTDEQLELGLYGPLLVRAPDEPTVDAERVLVLDDVDLDDAGRLRLAADAEDVALGRHGDVILVNGMERPGIEVAAGTTERWRIVNAANGRYFALELAGHEFVVVGGDGGPSPAAHTTDVLLIAPGERFDVLLTIAAEAGTRAWLRSAPVDRGHARLPDFDILELRIGPAFADPVAIEPGRFTRPIEPLPIAPDTPVRTFRLGEDLDHPTGPRFSINDELWPFNTPITAAPGDLEIWSLENEGDGDHPFHLHGVFFQVLDRDGVPEPRLAWKDTVRIGPHETLRLAVRHETPGMWMYHCQIPEHAEGGMMGDLMVSEPQGAHAKEHE
jgi:FtsP/CotA-like multicopper oxidase with cupredoxin domain